MATGTVSNFKIYDEQFFGGQMEASVSAFPLFNAAVRNTIVVENRFIKGNYEKESFLKSIASVIGHRDPTSTSAQTPTNMSQDEFIGVKIPRKFKEIRQTRDSWLRIGSTPQEMSRALGRKYEEEKLKDMVFTALLCVESALTDQSALVHDATATGTTGLVPKNLGLALAKFGDASQDVRHWFLHSRPWHDYLDQGITDKVNDIYRGVLESYSVPGLGRPFGVIDATALIDGSGSTATYNVLGLVEGAVIVTQSEPDEILFERVGGNENIEYRFQAEYAINVKLKGLKWDTTNGGTNPTDATLGTSGNWDKSATEDKHLPGVRLKVNSAND